MKQQHHDDDFYLDDLSPGVSAHIEHLSRKWAEDEDRPNRLHRRGLTRRRIEDWREEQALRRELDDDFDCD